MGHLLRPLHYHLLIILIQGRVCKQTCSATETFIKIANLILPQQSHNTFINIFLIFPTQLYIFNLILNEQEHFSLRYLHLPSLPIFKVEIKLNCQFGIITQIDVYQPRAIFFLLLLQFTTLCSIFIKFKNPLIEIVI